MNTSTINSNKQRGVYSEIINPDNSVLYQNASVEEDEGLYVNTQRRQKIPRANALKSKEAINQLARQSQTQKTMKKLEKIAVKIGQDDDEFDLKVEPKVTLL